MIGKLHTNTERVTDLELLDFELILTTFKLSIVFRINWGSIKNWLEPKIEPPYGYFCLSKSVRHSVENKIMRIFSIPFFVNDIE